MVKIGYVTKKADNAFRICTLGRSYCNTHGDPPIVYKIRAAEKPAARIDR